MDETIPLQNQAPTGGDYEFYSRIMAPYAELSPQRQGLTPEEFDVALVDPQVAKTEVSDGTETVRIPQLAPIESSQWLNADFYAKHFPEEYAQGTVLNFVDIPNTPPGPEVQERLRELAASGGVLTFDYPTADPQYPERVRAMLDGLGLQAEEAEVLGNQTYYAGQATLKRHMDPDAPKLTLPEAYERLVAEGKYDLASARDGASLQPHVDPQQARHMQQFYDAAYQVLNDHPCRQGLDPDEFLEMLTDRDWITKAVTSVDGEVQAVCLYDNELSELSWINTDYYKKRYPERFAKGQILWAPGLAASPDKKMDHNLQAIANLVSELADVGNNDSILAFDCCDKNAGFLDAALNTYINNTPHLSIDIQPIAAQQYCAIKLGPKQ
jgi:hypothetical protein